MRRNRYLVVLHSLLTAGLLAMLGLEVAAGDGWRSFGFAFMLLCWLSLRGDFTRKGVG